MTKKEQAAFASELREIIEFHKRRLAKLRSVERGEALYVRVRRRGYKVRAHTVRPHWIHIIRARAA